MYYVYLLKSKKDETSYVGLTVNLRRRLIEHEELKFGYTKGKAPYYLVFYSAFPGKLVARKFEVYLKSGSGRAFVKRHFF